MIGFPYFKGISIKNKIFATNIVIIIISITSIAIFANLVSQRAIIDKATNNSSRELFLINNNIETLITSVEDYSKMLATDYRLQEVLYQDMLENNPDGELEGLIMRKSISEIISNYIKPNNKVKAASVLTSHMNWVDVGYADNDSARQVFGANPVAMVHENITNPIWTGLFIRIWNEFPLTFILGAKDQFRPLNVGLHSFFVSVGVSHWGAYRGRLDVD